MINILKNAELSNTALHGETSLNGSWTTCLDCDWFCCRGIPLPRHCLDRPSPHTLSLNIVFPLSTSPDSILLFMVDASKGLLGLGECQR